MQMSQNLFFWMMRICPGGICHGGYLSGGYMSWGYLSWGVFVMGVFVWGVLSRGGFVLIPSANLSHTYRICKLSAQKQCGVVFSKPCKYGLLKYYLYYLTDTSTVYQQILVAIKFGVSQNKVFYVNLAAIKFGVSLRPLYAVYDRRICWWRQILAKTRNSPNSPNTIARQNLLIYSNLWERFALLVTLCLSIW